MAWHRRTAASIQKPLYQLRAGKQHFPATDYLPVRPTLSLGLGLINSKHKMIMIGNNGVGKDIDRKHQIQLGDPINNPLPAMLIRLTRKLNFATQKGAANTTGNTVIIRGLWQAYLLTTGAGHWNSSMRFNSAAIP